MKMSKHLSRKDFILIVLSVLFPPAAVYMMRSWGPDLLYSIILSLMLFVPGNIYATATSLRARNKIGQMHAVYLLVKEKAEERKYGDVTPKVVQKETSLEKGEAPKSEDL
jgi:uncharacterized membrane protein YqaE (UPF0057 family)